MRDSWVKRCETNGTIRAAAAELYTGGTAYSAASNEDQSIRPRWGIVKARDREDGTGGTKMAALDSHRRQACEWYFHMLDHGDY